MGINTRIYDRRQRLQLQQEQRESDQLGGHLRAAAKMCNVKGKIPIDVAGLSPAQEIALLQEYATRLESEAIDFLAAWPDKDGQRAARWFRMERAGVLDHIAKLQISSAKSDRV